MKFKATLEKLVSSVWGQHIMVPDKVVKKLLTDKGDKRVVCKVNDTHSFQAALMPAGQGTYFVNFSKQNSKKFGIKEGEVLTIELTKDDSKYGLPMPDEFQELLYQDEEGDTLFHALTAGKQRTLLHLIGTVKSQDIRIRKGLIILNHLRYNGGKIDFRRLQQDFKNYKNLDF